MDRHEWIGSRGQSLYVEGADGEVTDTNAGPDDLEAHRELLYLAEKCAAHEAFIRSFPEKAGALAEIAARPWIEKAAATERARIRRELLEWLVGDLRPEDAGIVAGRRIVTEIDRICPEEAQHG
jgi:hypothetical protein